MSVINSQRSIHTVICMLVLSLFSPFFCSAQGTPQYARKQSYVAVPNAWFYSAGGTTDTPARGRRLQFIYPDSEFMPRPTRGYIKNIYFWARGANAFNTVSTLYNVEIKMGYTQRDTFKHILPTTYGVRDTFISGLTTVFKADSVTEDLKTKWAYWWKLPLMGDGFYYNATSEQNLVVEFAFGLPEPKGWVVLADSGGGGGYRFLSGFRDSSAVQEWPGKSSVLTGAGASAQFGFDLVPGPQAVNGLESAADLQLYPNPSKGVFRLGAATIAPLQNAVITVRNLSGLQVWKKRIGSAAYPFSEEIDLSGTPPGVYLVELQTGELRLARPLVLQ